MHEPHWATVPSMCGGGTGGQALLLQRPPWAPTGNSDKAPARMPMADEPCIGQAYYRTLGRSDLGGASCCYTLQIQRYLLSSSFPLPRPQGG